MENETILWITEIDLFKVLYRVFLIMAIVPLASNTVALATELKAQSEKAAVAVLYSALFAVMYIPIVVSISS